MAIIFKGTVIMVIYIFEIKVSLIFQGKVCIALYFGGEKSELRIELVVQICPANSLSLHTLIRNFMKQWRPYSAKLEMQYTLCPAKSGRLSFKNQNNNQKLSEKYIFK